MSYGVYFCKALSWGIAGMIVGAGITAGSAAAYAASQCKDSDSTADCVKNWGNENGKGYFPFDLYSAIGAVWGAGVGIIICMLRFYQQTTPTTSATSTCVPLAADVVPGILSKGPSLHNERNGKAAVPYSPFDTEDSATPEQRGRRQQATSDAYRALTF